MKYPATSLNTRVPGAPVAENGAEALSLPFPEKREKYKCLRFQNFCSAGLLRTTLEAASEMSWDAREADTLMREASSKPGVLCRSASEVHPARC